MKKEHRITIKENENGFTAIVRWLKANGYVVDCYKDGRGIEQHDISKGDKEYAFPQYTAENNKVIFSI